MAKPKLTQEEIDILALFIASDSTMVRLCVSCNHGKENREIMWVDSYWCVMGDVHSKHHDTVYYKGKSLVDALYAAVQVDAEPLTTTNTRDLMESIGLIPKRRT